MTKRNSSKKIDSNILLFGGLVAAGIAAAGLLKGGLNVNAKMPSIIFAPPDINFPGIEFPAINLGVSGGYTPVASSGSTQPLVQNITFPSNENNLLRQRGDVFDKMQEATQNILAGSMYSQNSSQENFSKYFDNPMEKISGALLAAPTIIKTETIDKAPASGAEASKIISSYTGENQILNYFGQGALTGTTSATAYALAKSAGNNQILGKTIPGGGIVKGVLAVANVGATAGEVNQTFTNVVQNPSKKTSTEFASSIGGLFSVPTYAVAETVTAPTGPFSFFVSGLVSAVPTGVFGKSGELAYEQSQRGVQKFGVGTGTAGYNLGKFFSGQNKLLDTPGFSAVVMAANRYTQPSPKVQVSRSSDSRTHGQNIDNGGTLPPSSVSDKSKSKKSVPAPSQNYSSNNYSPAPAPSSSANYSSNLYSPAGGYK